VRIQLADARMSGSKWDVMVPDMDLAVARHADAATVSIQSGA
jgi:hypothetical protein